MTKRYSCNCKMQFMPHSAVVQKRNALLLAVLFEKIDGWWKALRFYKRTLMLQRNNDLVGDVICQRVTNWHLLKGKLRLSLFRRIFSTKSGRTTIEEDKIMNKSIVNAVQSENLFYVFLTLKRRGDQQIFETLLLTLPFQNTLVCKFPFLR